MSAHGPVHRSSLIVVVVAMAVMATFALSHRKLAMRWPDDYVLFGLAIALAFFVAWMLTGWMNIAMLPL